MAPLPAGSNENTGSYSSPWASLHYANRNVPDENCTVWFMPGAYTGVNRLNRRFETQTVFKSFEPYRAILQGNDSVLSISGATNITLEGFNIRHSGPGALPLLVAIDGSEDGWSEHVTLRNNIIHDSYNNDLLKVYNLSRFITIENNVFYNQGPPEEHMDVNSVTDVVIQDNIFFNDYESSGRINENKSKQFIVIKDSNGPEDGLLGSQRITVRRNIFLNWEGQDDETFIQVGLDGKPYFEAIDIRIENNLLIGNSENQVGAAFGVRGAKDVYFVNNTIVGDLPSLAYAARVSITERNPKNENIYLYNNIWSDPTGSMGKNLQDRSNEFSDGNPDETDDLILDNNLYWNGRARIPNGDLLSPLKDDAHRVVGSPRLATDQSDLVLPFWDGDSFLSGEKTIRDEFVRLVEEYGAIPIFSFAKNNAVLQHAPAEDILGKSRQGLPDLGAYEQQVQFNFPFLKMLP
ncbi:MAG: right-handed parallel beta-helix repeat-containing protein [Anaerolineales bacterium]